MGMLCARSHRLQCAVEREANEVSPSSDVSAGYGVPEPQQLRLLARVARMYHERGLKQPQIAAELHLSQPRVSRLLKQAVDLGVVRTTVTLPPGVYTDLEDQLQYKYGLRDVVVVDAGGTAGEVLP